ncbi:uncharacterized protein MYCFIDRAFT_181642 [Pseudocercospora fijiensis CIRAD86]|uniref:Uncharacterized protein n=1 Tax=Pseudocercospora fijiensis (strain CIRAD86) TaxID=383855 RepID=M2Z695_PSEFD|nr:uncharacterized protein MYCFIDRAFT_181642 [Pseudocercospora fijiensis CIRAD86]EME85280.1 hypothetical protein MYCFIDRAFT_181642 [Pseudocercospora fijiensis CIRAD86]
MISLLIVLLVLLILALLLVAGLLYMRHRRRAQRNNSELPIYDEKRMSSASAASSSHRRVMARPSESIYVYQEKQNLVENSSAPPSGPLPQIHITFPEEYDDTGKRVSGRVVVVRVGDTGVGLEPLENLPAYQQQDRRSFESVDLERVGGLVEKARNAPTYDKFEKI